MATLTNNIIPSNATTGVLGGPLNTFNVTLLLLLFTLFRKSLKLIIVTDRERKHVFIGVLVNSGDLKI